MKRLIVNYHGIVLTIELVSCTLAHIDTMNTEREIPLDDIRKMSVTDRKLEIICLVVVIMRGLKEKNNICAFSPLFFFDNNLLNEILIPRLVRYRHKNWCRVCS